MAERLVPTVVVLGSVHMDLIASAERLPGRGESVTGGTFTMAPGGKGGNQACQFSLAGARALMVTRLGDDMFGRRLMAALRAKGVDTSLVAIDKHYPTGASTVLAAQDDYASIIAPGAAGRLSTVDIDNARPALEAADALVIQLELPTATSECAAQIVAAAGKRVILNASPVPAAPAEVPETLWRVTSILVVNRVEAGHLLGRRLRSGRINEDIAELAAKLKVPTVVVTLGLEGATAVADGEVLHQPAFHAAVVDAVGAGDAFLGVFSTATLEGQPISNALRRGAAAATLALSRSGVYDALPSRRDVDAFLDLRRGEK